MTRSRPVFRILQFYATATETDQDWLHSTTACNHDQSWPVFTRTICLFSFSFDFTSDLHIYNLWQHATEDAATIPSPHVSSTLMVHSCIWSIAKPATRLSTSNYQNGRHHSPTCHHMTILCAPTSLSHDNLINPHSHSLHFPQFCCWHNNNNDDFNLTTVQQHRHQHQHFALNLTSTLLPSHPQFPSMMPKIGRASCRERV